MTNATPAVLKRSDERVQLLADIAAGRFVWQKGYRQLYQGVMTLASKQANLMLKEFLAHGLVTLVGRSPQPVVLTLEGKLLKAKWEA